MAFDPTTLFPGAAGDREGAILKIRPENLWKNKSGTDPVTADGDSVLRIDDISVNGRAFIVQTNAPTYHTDGTAHWLTFSGGGILESDVEWTFMTDSPYSVGAAIQFTATTSNQYFFSSNHTSGGSDNDSIIHVGMRSTDEYTIAHWFNDENFTRTSTTDAERHIAEYRDPGCEYFIDGSSIGSSASVPSALDEMGTVAIGGRDRLSDYLSGNVFGMIIVVDTITSQERADIDEWLQEQIEGEPTEQTVNVGLASETSSATSMVLSVTVVTGQSTETSTANAVTGAKVFALGQSTETAAATSVAGAKTHTSGQAAETDTATAVSGAKVTTAGLATETSAATTVEVSRTELALQAVEENNATAVTISRAWAVGQATETSTATGVAASGALNIGLSAETDAAQPVGHFRVATLGLGTVTDAAQPVAHSRATLVGQAGETNAASSLGHSRLAVVGVALESDTASSVTETGGAEPEPGAGDFWILRRRRRWV